MDRWNFMRQIHPYPPYQESEDIEYLWVEAFYSRLFGECVPCPAFLKNLLYFLPQATRPWESPRNPNKVQTFPFPSRVANSRIDYGFSRYHQNVASVIPAPQDSQKAWDWNQESQAQPSRNQVCHYYLLLGFTSWSPLLFPLMASEGMGVKTSC